MASGILLLLGISKHESTENTNVTILFIRRTDEYVTVSVYFLSILRDDILDNQMTVLCDFTSVVVEYDIGR